MSRIGKMPIELPNNVKVELSSKEVRITGPKGTVIVPLRPEIRVELQGNILSAHLENPTT
nr:50S ribosomal protein L6 [Patescibacteria group bacterium]